MFLAHPSPNLRSVLLKFPSFRHSKICSLWLSATVHLLQGLASLISIIYLCIPFLQTRLQNPFLLHCAVDYSIISVSICSKFWELILLLYRQGLLYVCMYFLACMIDSFMIKFDSFITLHLYLRTDVHRSKKMHVYID